MNARLCRCAVAVCPVLWSGTARSQSVRVRNVPAEYQHIQDAIDSSANGDTVLVSPGRYYENINYRGKDIVVTSRYSITGDVNDIVNTTIDGSRPRYPDSASVVLITSPGQGHPVLEGFTITGGTGTAWRDARNGGTYREGGGILSEFASPRIIHNIIVGNEALLAGGVVRSAGGGAIRCGNGEPEIIDNAIIGNRGGYGGAMVLYYTAATVKNNVIAHNIGGYSFGGGAIWIAARLARNSPNVLENNTIADNTAAGDSSGIVDTSKVADENGRGGAILVYAGRTYQNDVILRNNIIWRNNQRIGGAIAGDTAAVHVRYSDVQGGWRGRGNISADPLFPDATRYHLSPRSPGIEAGDPKSAFEDVTDPATRSRIRGAAQVKERNEMGAYGGRGAHVLLP
jgi:hypothetical protein